MTEYDPETDMVISKGLFEEMRLRSERLEFESDQLRKTKGHQDTLLLTMTEQLTDREWRLVLSDSFGRLMVKAYTAYQAYRIDYRKLKSYKGWDGIGWFEGSDQLRYREAMTRFISEIDSDIDAAIRRKTNIHEVPLK